VAIGEFQKKKKPDEDLFNRLDTSKLNAHLKEIMPGLTAKVFRTYNASITLDRLVSNPWHSPDAYPPPRGCLPNPPSLRFPPLTPLRVIVCYPAVLFTPVLFTPWEVNRCWRHKKQ